MHHMHPLDVKICGVTVQLSHTMSKRRVNSAVGAVGAVKKAKKSLPLNWADFRTGDDPKSVPGPEASVFDEKKELPTRRSNGVLVFKDYKSFQPNKTPREVIEAGAFGGCYFRPIESSVVNKTLSNQHLEFDFFADLPDEKLINDEYSPEINKYKVSCGGSLQMWQSKGWISPIDPYGWFQWYCRFYNGRRSSDDDRQVKRWERCTGAKGRWKKNLLTKIIAKVASFDDVSVSPVVRQTLLHWGYEITQDDVRKEVDT